VPTLNLLVNGQPLRLPSGSTIADVVATLTDRPDPKGVAVAVNRCVVPRSQWTTTVATEGSAIEIVTAAAGG
jgi:sulfur carrier protein